MNKMKWQIIYRSFSTVIDTYKFVKTSEAILEDVLDEAMNEASVSGPTISSLAAGYGVFELLIASVKDIQWNDLAALVEALMTTSELGLAGLWEVSSVIQTVR